MTSGAGRGGARLPRHAGRARRASPRTSGSPTSTAWSTRAASEDMDPRKERYARDTEARTLAEVIAGADMFLGLSAPRVLKPEMVAKMAEQPIILALANPMPEIMPEDAKAVRPDAIIATGRSDYPEPGQQRAVLPVHLPRRARRRRDADQRGDEARLRARDRRAGAWPSRRTSSPRPTAASAPAFGARVPDPAAVRPAPARGDRAGRGQGGDGVRRRDAADRRLRRLREKLSQFVFRTGLLMKPVFDRARSDLKRVVYAEGEEERVLRAVQTVIDEGLAKPILIGRPRGDRARASSAWACACSRGVDFELRQHRRRSALQRLLEALPRADGAPRRDARRRREPSCARARRVIAALMVGRGEADAMICGTGRPLPQASGLRAST